MTATVYNVNEGMNPELARACETLAGYAHLVALVRKGRHNGLDARSAVAAAVDRCIEEGVLAGYLSAKRAEVIKMFLNDFNEERHNRTLREEGIEEGLKRGLKQGRKEGLDEGRKEERSRTLDAVATMVAGGLLSLGDAASGLGFSEDELADRVATLATESASV